MIINIVREITYIFSGKRKENFYSNEIQAKEFYYGATEFNNSFKVNIIEFNDSKTFFGSLLNLIDKIFRKFFSLPFYMSKLISFNNFKILKKSEHIFLVNEGVGCSALPFLIILKFFKNTKVSLFVMGLYSKKIKFVIFKSIHNLLIKFLISNVDNVFFLGKGELNSAINFHNEKKEKFHFLPFSIDTKFWTSNEVQNNDKNIIFVGNDGNRDFDMVINIAKKLQNCNFTFISSNKIITDIDLPNVNIVSGFWGNKNLSDLELKDIYLNSMLSIIPLKESTQPSGQSVALQCMSLGIPVLISKTEGFWDNDLFIDNKNILFVNNESLEEWTNRISILIKDRQKLNNIKLNAKALVQANYNLDIFYRKLLTFLN